MKPFIIGITGGTGSGKTSFLKALQERFAAEIITCISQDDYYLPQEEQWVDENGVIHYDRPESIDSKAFAADLSALAQGKQVTRQEYTFNNPQAKPRLIVSKPAPLLLCEGLFIFHYKEVEEQIDLKIFIDAKEEIKLERRISRDDQERGNDRADVLYRYEHHIKPSFEQYILPNKDKADLIIPNNSNFEKGLEVVSAFIRAKIN